MRRGCHHGLSRFEDERGRRTLVETWRLASLADPHLLMQGMRVTCENYTGMVEIEAGFDEAELGLNHPHLEVQDLHVPAGLEARLYTTGTSQLSIGLASRSSRLGEVRQASYYQTEGRAGTALVLRRYICVYTSRDVADPAGTAIARAGEKRWKDFDSHRAAHETSCTTDRARARGLAYRVRGAGTVFAGKRMHCLKLLVLFSQC